MSDHPSHEFDVAITRVENLHWMSFRTDIVAAARFVAFRALSGDRIGAYDAYLMTTGDVEVFEDLDPDDPTHNGEAVRAHEDWHAVLTPMFKQALSTSVTR